MINYKSIAEHRIDPDFCRITYTAGDLFMFDIKDLLEDREIPEGFNEDEFLKAINEVLSGSGLQIRYANEKEAPHMGKSALIADYEMTVGSTVVYKVIMSDEKDNTYTVVEIDHIDNWALIQYNCDLQIKPTYTANITDLIKL